MLEQQDSRPAFLIGPYGEKLTLDDLPPTTTMRWSSRRKAEITIAVLGGMLTDGEACKRYGLSPEELAEWKQAFLQKGVRGLRASRLTNGRRKSGGFTD